VQRKWAATAKWLEATGEAGAEALANLERSGDEVTAGGLRGPLQSLLTPEARQAVLPTMASPKAKMRDLITSSAVATKAMWVGFHWAAAPAEYMREDLSMPPHPPIVPSVRGC
jgi:hypothetical protein